jgi:hypothetical protein
LYGRRNPEHGPAHGRITVIMSKLASYILAGILAAFIIAVLAPSCLVEDDRKSDRNVPDIDCYDTVAVENEDIVEASGIASSRTNPGVLWTHNDSGREGYLYAVAEDGSDLGRFSMAGIDVRDLEDIAVAPGPFEGVSFLYIGDIGDNDTQHDSVTVYRIPEPYVPLDGKPVDVAVTGTETITVVYPDGPHNAETLMVDPDSMDMYIVTKQESRADIYRASYPQSASEPDTLEFIATIPISLVTAGDISPSGDDVLLKNLETVYRWRRQPGETLEHAFEQSPETMPYVPEEQGEGIGWDLAGTGYFTISEMKGDQPVHIFHYYPELCE